MARKDLIIRAYITGDKEFQRKLKGAARAFPEESKDITLDVAEMIAAFARRKVPLGPARNGHVKYTLVGKVRRGTPVVDGGGLTHPYYGWLEFGGRVGINRSVNRAKEPDGRYIYPTVYERRPQAEEIMRNGLAELMRRHGIGVT